MATGVRGYLNNYATTLNGSITNVATSVPVNDATGVATLLSSVDYLVLTIDDKTNVEVVHVTAESGGTLTIERGKEGTSGTAFGNAVKIACRPTKEGFNFANLSGVDISGGSPSEDDQVKFDASGNLVSFTPSGGGGGEWEFVSTQTLGSAVSSVVFDISSGGTHKIVLDRVQNSGTANLLLTVAYSGPTYGTTAYQYTQRETNSSSTAFTNNKASGASSIALANALIGASHRPTNGEIILYEKDTDQQFLCAWNISTIIINEYVKKYSGTGSWDDQTNALVEVKLALTSGTMAIDSKFHLLKRTF